MSFLDDQASGQIEIGGKPTVDTLTRTRRRRKRSQAPMGTETYSLLPQNEFSNIVSTPSDITQVGIGKDLLKQGTAASEVPNVFDEYVSAAPTGSTYKALYGGEDDDEPDDDDIIDELESDPLVIPDADAGIGEDPSTGGYDWGTPAAIDPNSALGKSLAFLDGPTKAAAKVMDKYVVAPFERGYQALEGKLGDPNTGIPADQIDEANDEAAVIAVEGMDSPNVGDPSGDDGGDDGATSVSDYGYDPSDGGGSGMDADVVNVADGGVITKSKAKNKNSFMSMKGK